jgi:hypothetical protein
MAMVALVGFNTHCGYLSLDQGFKWPKQLIEPSSAFQHVQCYDYRLDR